MADVEYNVVLNFHTTMDTPKVTKQIVAQTETVKKAMTGSRFTDLFFDTKNTKLDSKQLSDIKKVYDTLLPQKIDTSQFDWVNDLEKKTSSMIDKSMDPTVKLKQAFSKMIDLENFKEMGGDLGDYNSSMAKVESTVKNLGGDFDAMSSKAKKMSKGFDMGMMSMMFFGMQLQRTFGGIYNSMLNTFKMLDKKGIMPLNRAITKMEAAFTFLSFSIIKSLEPILLPIIDAIVGVIDWFSQLPEPIQQATGALILFGMALGTGMFLLGTLSLGMGGVESFFLGMQKYVPIATTLLNDFGKASAFGVLGSLAGVLIVATAAFLVFTAYLNSYSKNSDEVDASLSRLDEAFWSLIDTLTMGMLDLPKDQTIWETFWSALGTGAKFGVMIVSEAITQLLIAMDTLSQAVNLWPSVAVDLLSGKGITIGDKLGGLSENFKKSTDSFSLFVNDSLKMGAEDSANTFNTTLKDKLLEGNMEAPLISSDLVTKYNTGLTDSAPLLNETTDKVFTDAGNVMKDIVREDVNAVIADVNRAMAALRELENKRKESSKATSVTNNNKSVVVNVKGSDNTKLVSDIKKAVA